MARAEKRRYRKVLCRMHSDAKYMALSKPQPNGQSLWQYLITGPHTTSVPGLFMAGEAQLAEALQWPLSGFRRAWAEIETEQNMGRADWRARVVWLPNAIRHNPPENPNVVKGWSAALDEIPECALKQEAMQELAWFLEGLGEAFLKPFPKPFGGTRAVGLANQEQEQEQEPSPQPPARGGRITRSERKQAEDLRRRSFGCTHEPRCANAEACIVTIVLGLREQAAIA